MNNKKIFVMIFLLVAIVLIFAVSKVSAQNDVCCQQLKTGEICQNAPIDQCGAGSTAPTSCDQTSYCQTGTCINTNAGTCTSNTPKSACESKGNSWSPKSQDEIKTCQEGCCLIGENVAFVTQTECKKMATDYAVNTTFRSDIKSETACFAAATPDVKGACVFEKTKDCTLTTKGKCLSTGGKFNKGLLCTATQLGTNCAKTDNTQCKDGKVYFLDSCGNLANVYDASMFKKDKNAWTAGMEDYWRNIQDAKCTVKDNYANCGDCNYISGTTCKAYDRNNKETQKPTYGNNVCADLSCDYQGQKYEQGESWCASSGGAYNNITVDPTTGEFTKQSRAALLNVNKYNLPGSRYYKLTCMDGKVLVDSCGDYRNEFCAGSTYENSSFRIAQCKTNDWRGCDNLTTKSDCENPSIDCKWVPGYRYDRKVLTKKGDNNVEQQGSCVPLVAPGFDFWKEGSSGSAICASGSVQDSVIYETSWLKNRNKFSSESSKEAAQSCLENCYLIPGYGNDLGVSGMESLWSGTSVGSLVNHFISLRKGHYCGNSKYSRLLSGGKANALGKVSGSKISCAKTRARTLPIFFTNSQWLNSIRSRERSLGDCGYKPNVLGQRGTPGSEIITAIFQKLKQDQTTVKSNSSIVTIYKGNERYAGYRDVKASNESG